MLKGRQRSTWDKVNSINYADIPMIEHVLDENEVKEFKYSKRKTAGTALILAIVLIASINESIRSPSWIKERPIAAALIGGFLIEGLVATVVSYFRNQIVIKLTHDKIEYKEDTYLWSSITNMYLRIQYDGDNYHYDLVIESEEGKKSISLNSLDSNYKNILDDIGRYYWNWVRRDKANTT